MNTFSKLLKNDLINLDSVSPGGNLASLPLTTIETLLWYKNVGIHALEHRIWEDVPTYIFFHWGYICLTDGGLLQHPIANGVRAWWGQEAHFE